MCIRDSTLSALGIATFIYDVVNRGSINTLEREVMTHQVRVELQAALGLMQIHSPEPTSRTMHWQFQVEDGEGSNKTLYGGQSSESYHSESLFDEFHPVPMASD
eukprot:3949347-Karenia_brevis.AAC.1